MSYNRPLSGNAMPRFGGIPSFMRLPIAEDAKDLDVAFVGVPLDIGTSNRPGARMGPRQIRDESRMLRPYHMWSGAMPFDSLQCADISDVPINTFNLKANIKIIEEFYKNHILAHGAIPMTLGGDHTIAYPILKAQRHKHGPVALVHVDAHADVGESMFGEEVAHGTPFRRAYEDGCLVGDKVWQIGLRGTGYTPDEYNWSRERGFHVVQCDELWYKSPMPLMEKVRENIGNQPVHLSFDIDSLDPGFAPGTGTAEAAGLTPPQAVEIVRGMRGLNIVGCDMVEVSPPYDTSGTTAVLAANLLYEMLCVLPGVKHHNVIDPISP